MDFISEMRIKYNQEADAKKLYQEAWTEAKKQLDVNDKVIETQKNIIQEYVYLDKVHTQNQEALENRIVQLNGDMESQKNKTIWGWIGGGSAGAVIGFIIGLIIK